jgi:hypothetical protein
VIVLAAACSPALDWREQRLGGQGLIVLLPCRPQLDERVLPLAGRSATMRLAACTADGRTWAAAEVELGPGQAAQPAMQALLDGAQRNLAAETLQPAGPVPAAGGRWLLQGRRPDGQAASMQLALRAEGRSVLQLSVIGAAPAASEALETFQDAPRWAR